MNIGLAQAGSRRGKKKNGPILFRASARAPPLDARAVSLSERNRFFRRPASRGKFRSDSLPPREKATSEMKAGGAAARRALLAAAARMRSDLGPAAPRGGGRTNARRRRAPAGARAEARGGERGHSVGGVRAQASGLARACKPASPRSGPRRAHVWGSGSAGGEQRCTAQARWARCRGTREEPPWGRPARSTSARRSSPL